MLRPDMSTIFGFRVVCSLALSAGLAAAAPSIAGVYNAASWVPAGLPSSSIAEGSIFTILGSGMGPASLVQVANYPLPSSQGVGGTTVQVTSGGSTLYCIMIYSVASQVAAILPSATPLGSATLKLTYNGSSSTIPIQVVKNSVGIFSINEAGSGPGVITNLNYQVIVPYNAAHPGDFLVLWATGLGPVSGDETEPPTPVDLGTGVQIFVGGQQATVLYGGRGSSPGLDQINFTVPAGVIGCYVSVVAQVNGVVSNFATIPITAAGQTFCSDPGGLSSANLSKVQAGGSLNVASMNIDNLSVNNGRAVFYQYSASDLIGSRGLAGGPSAGSCTVYVENTSGGIVLTDPFTAPGLNAGTQIAVAGPSGTQNMPQLSAGDYGAEFTSTFLTPGTYTLSNVGGGSTIGAFSGTLTFPQAVNWTNQGSTTNVSATHNLTVNWTGGPANGYVSIFGVSGLASISKEIQFFCTAQASAGTFTIPSQVFALLPPAGIGSNLQAGTNFYVAAIAPGTFTAPGLDYGFVYSSSVISTFLKITP
jgi:uncharacterized protein (TIGR03437 family)